MNGLYGFTDTTPVTGENKIYPAEAFKIDGAYLEDLVADYQTLQVTGRELLSQEIATKKIGISDGEKIQYVRKNPVSITIKYLINARNPDDFRQDFHLLNSILSGKNHQIIFHDDPTRYYIATLQNISDPKPGANSVTATFSLLVPDGIAHSVATKTANNMPYKDVPVNLLVDSSFESGKTPTNYIWGDGKVEDRNFQVIGQLVSFPPPFGKYMLQVANWSSDSSTSQDQYAKFPLAKPVSIKAGETWTYSYYYGIIGSAVGRASDFVYTNGTDQVLDELSMGQVLRDASGPSTAWHRFAKTWTADRDVTVTDLRFGFVKTSATPGWVCIDNIKLEQEPTASPWSPNPTDPEYYTDTITVLNLGTAPTAPIISATMHGDNGLVALVNDQGATLQFGSVDERDNVAAKKSDPTLHLDYGYLEGDADTPEGVTINTGVDLYPNYLGNTATPNERAGSVEFGVKTPDGMVSAVPKYTGTAKDVWTGPSMHVDVTPNSDNLATGNFIFEQQFHFESTTRTSGRIEFVLEHGADVAFSFVMRSSTSLSDEVVVEIGAGNPGAKGTMFISYTLDRKKFTNGYYQLIISRVSGVITYKLSKILRETVDVVSQTGAQLIRTFNFSTLSSAAVWPITGINTQWRRWPGPDASCTMDVADTRFTWVNVDYLQDIPNRFSNGDVLTVDVANKRILVNGVEDMTLHTVGNQWDSFMLQPGENTIEAIQSSWAKTPLEVSVQYREVYY